jgi:hypothetical protein
MDEELYDLVERCQGDDTYTVVSGGVEISRLIIEKFDRILAKRVVFLVVSTK